MMVYIGGVRFVTYPKEEWKFLPISGEVLAVTKKAILLDVQNLGEIWVPKSLAREETFDITVELPEWWYRKRGFREL